ncbi:hypothetical protein OB920_13690 [Halobacteria archaeon HArc-gm2]|nr:hypothetical protein [Halobacteria archaeon HArc-gm2]
MTDYDTVDFLYDERVDTGASMERIWASLRERSRHSCDLDAERDAPADSWRELRWNQLTDVAIRPFGPDRDDEEKPVPDLPHVEVRYDPEPFRKAIASREEAVLAETAVDLLELLQHVYAGAPDDLRFVYGVSAPHKRRLVEDDVPPPATPESLDEDRIQYASWMMGFPPSLADTYGQETLLSAPAWQTAELGDGGVALLTTENPTNVCKPETRAIDQHLDLDPPPETEECDY